MRDLLLSLPSEEMIPLFFESSEVLQVLLQVRASSSSFERRRKKIIKTNKLSL